MQLAIVIQTNPISISTELITEVPKCFTSSGCNLTNPLQEVACQVLLGSANMFISANVQSIDQSYHLGNTNVVEKGIKGIFQERLGQPDFLQYVTDHVKFRHSNNMFFCQGDCGMTENDTIFFNTFTPSSRLVVHELTHIWQYRRLGILRFSERICDAIANEDTMIGGKNLYKFDIRNDGRTLSDYGPEQQAEIVKLYFLHLEKPAENLCTRDVEGSFTNCTAESHIGRTI